jgi:serine/threonine-protein kinase HipA
MTDAAVRLWGTTIGAVSWLDDVQYGVFQYEPAFAASGIQLAPLTMPLGHDPFSFPALPRDTFKGLPGMLADSLPDKFGNRLIDAWLAQQGRTPASFDPVERLCYIGTRGIGALEFEPSTGANPARSTSLRIADLVELANRVLDDRAQLSGKLKGSKHDQTVLEDILRVGTSAGGARAKAVLAWNPATGEFRSGQVAAGSGFEHWLLKFDGVTGNADKELADPLGFGRIEFAYSLMARQAGIQMTPCRLHLEGGRAHFMTKRFDRTDAGDKLHMQSLTAMMHYDFNAPGAYSYEQPVQVLKHLGAAQDDIEQQVLRALFNVLARNQDDHPKNIAYLMDRTGNWRLSPAFDLSYSYNPSGAWTDRHQMSLNGKRDGFEHGDLMQFCAAAGYKRAQSERHLGRVIAAVREWPRFAQEAGVPAADIARISRALRHETLAVRA